MFVMQARKGLETGVVFLCSHCKERRTARVGFDHRPDGVVRRVCFCDGCLGVLNDAADRRARTE